MGLTGGTDFINNLCGTTAGLLNLLAPFWDDLNLGGGSISVDRLGEAPNRVFIVQYDSVHFFSGSGVVTFQIKLYETTNVIDFLYGQGIPNPNATGHVGINKAPGGSGNIIDIVPGSTCSTTTTYTTTCVNVPYNIPNGTKYWFGTGIPLGMSNNNSMPRQYTLAQNYPNPFNPTTVISYALPKSGLVKLVVYDVLGRTVQTLVNNEFKEAGTYKIDFNGTNLSSGVYFYRIDAGDFSSDKKMLLFK